MDYALRTEVPGVLGSGTHLDKRGRPVELHVELDGWMGDDICAVAGNNYFVTARLRDAILSRALTGCEFGAIRVTRSAIFEELQGDVALPEFSWLRVLGVRGSDFSVGAGPDGTPILIVSEAALKCLQGFSMGQCHATPVARQGDGS